MTDTSTGEAIDAVLAGALARDVESDRLDFKTLGRSREDMLVDLDEVRTQRRTYGLPSPA